MAVIPDYVPNIYLPKYLMCLIHGHSDSGKSIMASGADLETHQFGDFIEGVLFGDADGGMASLASKGILVERWPHDPNKLLDSHTIVEDMIKYVEANPGKYHILAVDTLTRLQEHMQDALMRRKGPSNELLDQRDWGRLLVRMLRLAMKIPKWKAHVIVTAHSRYLEDKADGMMKWMPMVQGRFADELPGFFDIVGYLKKEVDKQGNITRKLHLSPMAGALCRSRLDFLPPVIENPSFPKLIQLYEQRRDEAIERLKAKGIKFQLSE
jgi:hypothetical protein